MAAEPLRPATPSPTALAPWLIRMAPGPQPDAQAHGPCLWSRLSGRPKVSLLHDSESMIAHVGVDLPCSSPESSAARGVRPCGLDGHLGAGLTSSCTAPGPPEAQRASRIHGPCALAVHCRTVDMADTSEWRRLPAEFDRHQAKAHSCTRPDHSAS